MEVAVVIWIIGWMFSLGLDMRKLRDEDLILQVMVAAAYFAIWPLEVGMSIDYMVKGK